MLSVITFSSAQVSGTGMNTATGVFTCATPGTYTFSFTGYDSSTSTGATVTISRVDGTGASLEDYITLTSGNSDSNSISGTTVVTLANGDKVAARLVSGALSTTSSSRAIKFTGVLLRPTAP